MKFNFSTLSDLPAKDILIAASKQTLQRVTIIGVLENGEPYHASTTSDCGAIFWDLEVFKYNRIKRSR